MKKRLLLSLLVIGLLIVMVMGQDDDSLTDIDPSTGLPYKVGEVKDIGDKITDEKGREFLKKEYGEKLKENKYLGWMVGIYDRGAFIINPVSKYVFGMEPDLSWLFVLNIVISITLVTYSLRFLEFFSLFSKTIQFIVSFAFLIALSLLKVTVWISEQIINVISKLPNWWLQLIGVGIVIIVLVTANVFSSAFRDIIKGSEKKQEENKEEFNRRRLKQKVEVAEAFTEGLMGS